MQPAGEQHHLLTGGCKVDGDVLGGSKEQGALPPAHYTEGEVAELLACAADNGLAVVPLLQTFGHLEVGIV